MLNDDEYNIQVYRKSLNSPIKVGGGVGAGVDGGVKANIKIK